MADLTTSQVAELFHVGNDTVVKWTDAGKLPSYRTLGGHRRYREDEIRPLLPATEALVPAVCPYHDEQVAEVVPGSDVWCRFCRKWFTVEKQAS